ncbi:bifunctional hydroxymethylpyrimidine kinase/phosphomethylpyrimidine kinase [Roseibium sediminis]|uniref:bifunctional hydroxymethylpyrimidine kinase/phosphomethylpyrimidine kinase n=1 Tax=Roseibium sediminis TaxID=1775174 RepID=UPI00123CC195|nr:bifunctional hydroxymethylpyrimidine kinase/phosphomethylpyrimidine kinase [Roseibium sediminis]
MTAIAVTIAGSDSGGGAGIQADLKAFSARGVYGASVLTALTAQNTLGVTAIHDVPEDFVRAQMDAVYSDLAVNATKIGMLSVPATIKAVSAGLKAHATGPVVLDPVMVAASGDPLLVSEAVSTLVEELFPLADVITPNLHEAAHILGTDAADSEDAMRDQAHRLIEMGARAVLLKGGHGSGAECADLLLSASGERWFRAPRHETTNTHGTGCTLSSTIAAELAKGSPLETAVEVAKSYITDAIAAADTLDIGKGHGPVHHFHAFWR